MLKSQKKWELLANAISHLAAKERKEWPPVCTIGIWYQPKRPAYVAEKASEDTQQLHQ